MNSMKRLRFTLLELLVVIAIIAILAGMILGGVMVAVNKSKEAAVRAECIALKSAVQNYLNELGDYPFAATADGTAKTIDSSVLTVLNGSNPRGVKFYGKSNVSNPFGGSFEVHVDADFDNDVETGDSDIGTVSDICVVKTTGKNGQTISSVNE